MAERTAWGPGRPGECAIIPISVLERGCRRCVKDQVKLAKGNCIPLRAKRIKLQIAQLTTNTPQQTKRILGIIPNYRAISANTQLPPLSIKAKFWLGTQDTFDYSNSIFVGMLSGVAMAGKSEPSFGQGAAGYGRYYWHTFVDVGVGNYMTESIVPTLTKEDPRYYTLGRGSVFKRTGYAVSRLFITRTDAGHNSFNFSEIVGNGAAAGISNAYYPSNVNTFVKTYQRWGWQIAFDGIGNTLKEYWPEINHSIFHEKY